MIKFPYYSGNIMLTKVLGYVTLDKFIESHKNPKPAMEELMRQIRECGDPKTKRILKQELYSFTPSCMINIGDKRQYANITKFTGLMQVDLDEINDPKIAYELKQWLFDQPECVCSYFSPSGNVKGLIRIETPKTKDQYKLLWNAVAEKYDETGFYDSATKNAVLPLFLSIDKEILYRPFEEAEPWRKEKDVVIEYNQLNDHPTSNDYDNHKWFVKKTFRILNRKIESIDSNGHPQVRSAALILGSRVAAGYLSRHEAMMEIESLIRRNNYLQKGVDGYLKTAEWGINEGMKNPKYY